LNYAAGPVLQGGERPEDNLRSSNRDEMKLREDQPARVVGEKSTREEAKVIIFASRVLIYTFFTS